MKQLKLEVGKTYRSRKGEEVKIVEKQETVGRHAYRGSDDEWYTERGRFNLYVGQSGSDLIEEVPSETTRHTFVIPDGIKGINVSKEGNRIVVEMVPEVKGPKPGDVMVNEHGSVYVFKAVTNNDYHTHYAWLAKPGRLFIDYGCCAPGRPATSEEAQPLWDALKKEGKQWTPEIMQVEDVPEIDRILEWVEENIKDGYYNQEDVAEAIEGYLNQKEDKK